jgi:hypothetical protein
VSSVTVASDAANVARRPRWTANRARRARDGTLLGTGTGVALVTNPASLRTVTAAYSIGRVAMPEGSRPASTQPMSVAATGMTITMKNRLFHGT